MADDPNLFEMRRLEQLSNTVFGVAMTLLAYDLPRGVSGGATPTWHSLADVYVRPLIALGLIREPLEILYTPMAVVLGMVYVMVPFMFLPLFAAIDNLDRSLVEASMDLGANRRQTFLKVILPQTMPGIIGGAVIVFIPAVGEFVIPDLLGGSDVQMIGKTLWEEFFANRDWPVASAVAIALLIILVVPIVFFQNAQARSQEAGR